MNLIKKILVIRLSSIGDIILASPLLRCLRNDYPKAEITFVVKKEFASLVSHNPNINQVIEFDKNSGFRGLKKLTRQIRQENYDVYIDIHKNLRSRYIGLFSGIRFRFTYSKMAFYRSLFIRLKWNLYPEIKPVFLRYFEAVQSLDVIYDGQGTEVFLPDLIKIQINQQLEQYNPEHKKIIVLSPGASFENKKWPVERFIGLADFYSEHHDVKIALIGGKQDVDICYKIEQSCKNPLINLAGKCSLLESASAIAASEVVITHDTGMMHLAQSQKIPVVAIYGPTTKELGYFPLPARSRVVEVEGLTCRPCSFHGLNYCPKKHHKCMKDISTDTVIKAINELIGIQ